MPITKNKVLYEVLFRFDEAGKAQGCHAIYREIVTEDGEILADRIGQAIPVSLLDAADKLTVKTVIGDAMFAVVKAKDEAVAEVTSLKAEVITKGNIIADKEAAIAEKEAIIATKAAKVVELEAMLPAEAPAEIVK